MNEDGNVDQQAIQEQMEEVKKQAEKDKKMKEKLIQAEKEQKLNDQKKEILRGFDDAVQSEQQLEEELKRLMGKQSSDLESAKLARKKKKELAAEKQK